MPLTEAWYRNTPTDVGKTNIRSGDTLTSIRNTPTDVGKTLS